MTALMVIWAEFLGLFLDDGRFAGAILGWLALCWIVLPRLDLAGWVKAIVLFAALAGILVESAVRRARSRG